MYTIIILSFLEYTLYKRTAHSVFCGAPGNERTATPPPDADVVPQACIYDVRAQETIKVCPESRATNLTAQMVLIICIYFICCMPWL